MIPIFIKSKSFGLLVLANSPAFIPYGVLQGQVRKNFGAKGLLPLEKWRGLPKQKKGLNAPLLIDS
jgi:hypothetical protein